MPIALDPKEIFEVVLKSDADKPPEIRPAFVFHYLTAGQWKRLMLAIERPKEEAPLDIAGRYESAIREGLAGWRNMIDREGRPIPYDPEKLLEILTLSELHELFKAMTDGNRIGAQDAKKSGPQSQEALGESALPAAAATA